VRVLRNVAIVMLLALPLALLPSGGDIAEGVITALTLVLFGAMAALLVRAWRENALARDAMTDRQRGLVYGGLGAVALMIVGTDELFDSGPGTIVWIAVMVGSIWLIVNTWREAQSL
jgi:peptidoglycan/LPS O-acetylase OafA/YrhL